MQIFNSLHLTVAAESYSSGLDKQNYAFSAVLHDKQNDKCHLTQTTYCVCFFFLSHLPRAQRKHNRTKRPEMNRYGAAVEVNILWRPGLYIQRVIRWHYPHVLCVVFSLRRFRNDENVSVRVSRPISQNKLFLMKSDQLVDKGAVMSWVIYGKRFRKQRGGGEHSPL